MNRKDEVMSGTGHPTPLSTFPEFSKLAKEMSDLQNRVKILEKIDKKLSRKEVENNG